MGKLELKARLKDSPKMLLDGSMGALLMSRGFRGSGVYSANFTDPGAVASIQRSYLEAGSELILTNTFSITDQILASIGRSAEEAVSAAFRVAETARQGFEGRYIALNLAPYGFMEPLEESEKFFRDRIEPVAGLVDAVFFETFSNAEELITAIRVARELTDAPIFASMTFQENGKSWKGESLFDAIASVASASPDAVGMNCTVAPLAMAEMAEELQEAAGGRCAVFCEANRGIPEYSESGAAYAMEAEAFADGVAAIYEKGVKILGGCCGSDPECIRLIRDRLYS
ncbi:MAG: homocysteine S-methyltransferase family protein [Eubacteriaceae bacterium]|nr:homocysteine S-methyltransferase family protein [Eubacteriaceae bacterium]